MLRPLILASVSALALAACGQSPTAPASPATTAEAPSTPALAPLSDAEFAQQVANSDAFEIQAAALAASKGVDARVKNFARMMNTEHSATTRELTAALQGLSQPAPTVTLSPMQGADLAALRTASGAEFDTLYIVQQIDAHEAAIGLFERYIATAAEGPLKTWAQATLPKLRTHLTQANALNGVPAPAQ